MAPTTGDEATTVPTRVLVLGMAHADGVVHGDEVFEVAEACGLSADQVRSCLRRLVAEGLFVREGTGRSARFAPTPAGEQALSGYLERARLAYVQDAAGRGWDNHWHLVAFAVPEAQRAARDALRERLVALGGAAIHNGLYVSPHPWEPHVGAVVDALGIAGSVTFATTDSLTIAGESDARVLARRLWPLDELAERYRRFIEAHAHVPDLLEGMLASHRRLDDAAFLSGTLRSTVAFQQVFDDDPLLPPELVPRPWPGRTARELLIRSRRLGMRVRSGTRRPALFRTYDELLESIP